MDIVLTTDGLQLRPTGPHLFEGIWTAMQSSLPELSPWMPWAINPDPKQTREFLERAGHEWGSGTERHFTVFENDNPCGQCSLDHNDPWGRSAELGYWMRTDLCGRGLMTEAASEVIKFGFSNLDLHRIELHAGTENAASIRVAEKLGFRREGLLRDAGIGGNGYYDTYVYGLLATDPGPHASSGQS